MKTNSLNIRDERIDSVKYCLMLLVIIGHIFGNNVFSTSAEYILNDWIYMFHMPLFIFISGYFSRKKDKEYFLISCWKLIEPLIIFQLLIRGLDFIITGKFSLTEIFTPWWVLWYLLSLIYWRIMLQILPNKILSNTKLFITLAFLVSLFAGFIPVNRFLSLQRTFAFMPFFLWDIVYVHKIYLYFQSINMGAYYFCY